MAIRSSDELVESSKCLSVFGILADVAYTFSYRREARVMGIMLHSLDGFAGRFIVSSCWFVCILTKYCQLGEFRLWQMISAADQGLPRHGSRPACHVASIFAMYVQCSPVRSRYVCWLDHLCFLLRPWNGLLQTLKHDVAPEETCRGRRKAPCKLKLLGFVSWRRTGWLVQGSLFLGEAGEGQAVRFS